MNVVFRAIRFGTHLAVNYPGLLFREVASFGASFACWPVFKMVERSSSQKVEILCDTPVAVDSPDHIAPRGTAENHMTHFGFIVNSMRLAKASASVSVPTPGAIR